MLRLHFFDACITFYSHIGVELEIASLVAKSKVVLHQFGLSCVKCHLVTSQPPCVAQNS